MEKIEALVNVLGRFGDELGTLKDLIAEMQAGVSKQTADLRRELQSYKASHQRKSTGFSDAEKEIQDRLRNLKAEIGKLEILKRRKEDSLRDGETMTRRASINDVSKESPEVNGCKTWKPTWNEYFDYQSGRSSPTPSLVSQCSYRSIKREEQNNNGNGSPAPHQPRSTDWWKEDNSRELQQSTSEQIDWNLERKEREDCKHNLMIQEGWKRTNATYEDLEAIFSIWTGKFIKWTVVRRGRSKGGKALFSVKFESLEDRDKVFSMRKQIAEEGHLFVGEALSYVEKKERWTMLLTSERLKREGRNVEFENRRICVDGEWWKYDWEEGWKRLNV